MNLDDRLAEPSSLHPLGTDQLGRDFLSPPDPRRAPVAVRRAGGDHPARGGRSAGRRRSRVSRRQIRLGGAALRRRVDVDAGAAGVADHHVAGRPRSAADHSRARHLLGHQQFPGGARCRHRHQGERLLPGRPGGWQPRRADPVATRAAECHAADHHHLLDHDRRHHRGRGLAELPRLRAATRCAELGRHAQPGGTPST